MTIRGGGDTTCAVVSIPLEECARRPGALPPKRMTASWSGPDIGLTEYKVAAPCYAPRRAPLRSPVSQRCFGLRAEDGPVQMRYVTRDNAMPRGCKPERERALSNAERQARYRARQHDQMAAPKIRYRWPADRRSRAQRWCDAVNELLTIANPNTLRGSTRFPTAFAPRRQESRCRLSPTSTSVPGRD